MQTAKFSMIHRSYANKAGVKIALELALVNLIVERHF